MANTFSETEYHLTISKALSEEMFKNIRVYDSSKIIKTEVGADENNVR